MLWFKHFVALVTALICPSLFAHIGLDGAGTHLSRYGNSEIKTGPCGRAGGTRGDNIYTYRPGEVIEIKMKEYIPHPGYFRISFDNDGDDDFVNPQSVDPINRSCLDDPADRCGEPDFFNNETVLLDNLDPHKRGFPKTYSWKVTLPDIECDNCTLQILQVMTDGYPIHAPYDPSMTSDDLYYQCIDLVLKKEG